MKVACLETNPIFDHNDKSILAIDMSATTLANLSTNNIKSSIFSIALGSQIAKHKQIGKNAEDTSRDFFLVASFWEFAAVLVKALQNSKLIFTTPASVINLAIK